MPQESSTTSLIGQGQASSLDSSLPDESIRPIYHFARGRALGASQDELASETANFSDKPDPPIPNGATLRPFLKVTTRGRDPVLQTRQLWEGTVTEVRDGEFVAILSDRTSPKNPDEQVAFDFGEVSPADRELVRPGSVLYWIVGSERTVGGQVKNVSILQFRRVPAWTQSALSRAAVRAQRIREAFQGQE